VCLCVCVGGGGQREKYIQTEINKERAREKTLS
jgi:iron only hydrogenase large subunit-like protein